MGRTLTNNFSLEYAIEDSIGVLPGSPEWKLLEPNAISAFASAITTVPRSPISKYRQRRKGSVTDLDSSVEFDADLTLAHFRDFIEGFCFANFVGPAIQVPTDVDANSYTVPTGVALVENDLVYARGFTNTENNGLKEVAIGATTTDVPVEETLVVEASVPATQNVSLEVTGFRFASGDLEVDVDGNLTTTIKDFTDLDLTAGQSIWVGGAETVNQFATADDKGYARIITIAANKLTIDKTGQAFSIDAGAAKLIDLYFGQYIKNVGVDDSEYLERSFTFEGAYQNLAAPGPGDAYEYAKGNFCNTVGFELPLADKATMSLAFVGTDTEPPTETRETNAGSPLNPVQTGAFNTSADIVRLRIQDVDETGLTTDFKSITLNINNNVSPEKVLGQLGAKYMNAGNFEIDIEAQLLFTDPDVITAVRENRRVTMDFSIRNDDGAFLVDIPSMTLGGGDREFPVNESILINTTAQAYGDTQFGNSLSVSMFPYVPNF